MHLNVQRIFLLLSFCCLSASLMAQSRTISGKVTDETQTGLIGANILVMGSSTGAVTDLDGSFSMEIDASATQLEVSYIGYAAQVVDLTAANYYEIQLSESVAIEEMVVTALGVEREEKALGYSVQNLGAKQIATVKPTNVTNALAGKVSGVYVSGSAAGPTASANINIRGAASLLGNNQPLFVVNGMPITNDLYSFDDGLNGSSTIDFGNAAQIINPDDIASVNILKDLRPLHSTGHGQPMGLSW